MQRSRSSRSARAIAAIACLIALAGCTAAPAQVVREPTRAEPRTVIEVDPIEEYADDRIAVMTLEDKVRSLLMLHYPGTDAAQLAAFVERTRVGGLILMGDNIPVPVEQLPAIIASLSVDTGLPILTAIDQEGGIVRRISDDPGSSASQLRGLPAEAARASSAARAAMLDSLGISVNFGIVADVTGDSTSFIQSRTLGSTGAEAAPRVAEAVAGEHGSVFSTLKHFPGHGAMPGDSHSQIPTSAMGYDEWLATQAPPFAAGIDAGAELVMTGHLQFDAIDPRPASLSTRWVTILRDDLGFDGVIVSDDMLMLQRSGRPELADATANAIAALAAGTDMLLFVLPADPATVGVDVDGMVAAIVTAVGDGRIPVETIDSATHRLLELRRTASGYTGPFVHCDAACRQIIE